MHVSSCTRVHIGCDKTTHPPFRPGHVTNLPSNWSGKRPTGTPLATTALNPIKQMLPHDIMNKYHNIELVT